MSERPLVLAYHAVSSTWPSQLGSPEARLREQLAFLRRRGFVGLTAGEAERRRQCRDLPKRVAVITFDDGFRSILRARPILADAGFPATVFVVTSFVDSGDPLCWYGIEKWSGSSFHDELRPLGWHELELLRDGGWEIGSHSVAHRLLPTLSDAELGSELTDSRLQLVRRLGVCETIAYPYGRADDRVAVAAAQAGYIAGFTLTLVQRPDTTFLRPRVELTGDDTGLRLRARLSRGALAARRSRAASSAARCRRALAPAPAWLPPERASTDIG